MEILRNQENSLNLNLMTKTCTAAPKVPGETVTMRAAGSGGTPNYTVIFRKDAAELARFTGIPPNTEKTFTYRLVSSDVGTRRFSMELQDSCAAGAKTCTEYCDVAVTKPALGAATLAGIALLSVGIIGGLYLIRSK